MHIFMLIVLGSMKGIHEQIAHIIFERMCLDHWRTAIGIELLPPYAPSNTQ